MEDWAARALTVPDELLDIGLDRRLVQKELERIAGRFEATATSFKIAFARSFIDVRNE